MRINGASEFYHFLVENQLVGLNNETSTLSVCFDEYSRMCNCDSIEARNAKLSKCKSIYIQFLSKAQSYKSILLSKSDGTYISFCNDNQLILTLNR